MRARLSHILRPHSRTMASVLQPRLTSWLTYLATGLPGLEGLNEDTFRLIAYEARGIDDALFNLSAVSRRIRELVMPILFAHCWTDYYGNHGVPPPSIRPFIQYAVLAHV